MTTKFHTYILCLLCCLPLFTLYAQTQPQGKFLSDTVKIGEPVKYVLTFRHAPEMEVFFPDSAYDFSPFEFLGKNYFPTNTQNRQSQDCVVYELSTFELSPVQYLAVPAFVLRSTDTAQLMPTADSIEIKATVLSRPDTLKLIENTRLVEVQEEFNYPYLLITVGAVTVSATLVFLLFGGRIRKAYKLRRLKRQYERFHSEFEKTLARQQDGATTEQGLSLWKAYLETLQNIPFTSYTSTEIAGVIPDEKLNNSLKNIDMAIYGGRINEQTRQSLQVLKEYALDAYNEKVKEVRNA